MAYVNSGLNHVAPYQLSADPWVTASLVQTTKQIQFDRVTKFFTINNTQASSSVDKIYVAFTQNGLPSAIGGHYFTLLPGNSFNAEMRVKELWFESSNTGSLQTFEVIAGLTTVTSSIMWTVTGSLDVG